MRKTSILPYNLQLFAEGEGGTGAGADGSGAGDNSGVQNIALDYDKLASLINGKQTVTEDTILKNYFKQQGLSADEASQAIKAFKDEKAKNTPDLNKIQNDLASTTQALNVERINSAAALQAMSLGLDAKAAPYVIKLADFSKAVGADGSISAEEVKKAMEQVLTDVPGFKSAPANAGGNNSGGFQLGGNAGGTDDEKATQALLEGIFGVAK